MKSRLPMPNANKFWAAFIVLVLMLVATSGALAQESPSDDPVSSPSGSEGLEVNQYAMDTQHPTAAVDNSNAGKPVEILEQSYIERTQEILIDRHPGSDTKSIDAGPFTACDSVDVPQAECETLVALYNATGGPSWNSNSGWLESNLVCTWEGIGCNGTNVQYIDLSYNNLVGTLNTDLTALTWLWILDLTNNSLTGDMSTVLTYLPNTMGYLFLSENSFTGTIPSLISTFTNIDQFSAGNNQLTGNIATIIGYFPTTMSVLILNENSFTGTVPAEIADFVNLYHLNLSGNQLEGDMTTLIGNLPAGLGVLHLSSNNFSGTIPDSISDLTQLTNLTVANNSSMNGTISLNITALSLIEADFSGTQLCEPTDPTYAAWKDTVVYYTGGNCPFSSCANVDIPEAECDALVALYTATNGDSWTDNGGWFGYNKVCNWSGVNCDADSVYMLSFDGNNLVGSLEVDLTGLTNLQYLHFGNNQLTGNISTILGYMPTSLLEFEAYNNDFNGSIPASISTFTNLTYFNVGGCQITGDLGTIIGNLPSGIVGLGLWGNNLTGTIPSGISSLTSMTWLSLGENQLEGDFPTIVGYLPTGMDQLYLYGNLFTGTIPDSISNLSVLRALDVGNNSGMNGTISMNITALPLEWAHFIGTELCEPNDPAYDTWKATVISYSEGTCTAAGIIFSDDFETGDLSLWSRVNDSGGFLYACTDAAVNGSYGACVARGDNDKRKQLNDLTPVYQTTFSTQFIFDVNSLHMGQGERFRFMQVKMDQERPFFLVIKYDAGQYYIQLNTKLDDLSKIKSDWILLTNEPHTIEVDWQVATADGANNGFAELYIDGGLQVALTGLDNDTLYIDKFKLGFTSTLYGKDIDGIFYLDDVYTSNDGYIGTP